MTDLISLLQAPASREYAPIFEALGRGQRISVFGMDTGYKAHLTALIKSTVLFVCSNLADRQTIYDDIVRFVVAMGGDKDSVAIFDEREDILSEQKAMSHEQTYKRLATLEKLIEGRVRYLITTTEALLNYLPRVELFKRNTIDLRVGETMSDSIPSMLVRAGYKRQDTVDSKGTFSNRGDTIYIYPIGRDNPVRIELWGDTIDTIKSYDAGSMNMLESVEEVKIIPCIDTMYDIANEVVAKRIECVGYRGLHPDSIVRRKAHEGDMYVSLANSVGVSSSAWILPFVKDDMATIYDYLPQDSVIVYDECKILTDRLDILYHEYTSRVNTLAEKGEVTPEHITAILPRDKVYSTNFSCLTYQQITTDNRIYKPDAVFSENSTTLGKYYIDTDSLIGDIRGWRCSDYSVVMCLGDRDDAEHIARELKENYIVKICDKDSIESNSIVAIASDIKYSLVFHTSRVVLIGQSNLSRKKVGLSTKKKRQVFVMPKEGDYVVHDDYGIGRFIGIKRIKTNVEKEYAEIEYRDGDKLYLPVEHIDMIERYSGSEDVPILSKLGGKEFAKVKAKVKQSVKELAINLIELYSAREQSKGYKYSEDSSFQREFEDAFPYEETPDQITAINEIKSDMQSGKIMDRLLCGDVGYGKTEVALRAIFKAILDGKQCAMLAPTTILAEQHYKTALERFEPYGIRVACVNRFRSAKELKQTIIDLGTGKINLVVGTHRLLSKDVIFSDLGLLVLDEEQRFGVEDKEKIKELKRNVDVLTMSATPIPRTLHMSMSGIRDISVLETAPKGRIPVETHVGELTDGLIVDVISREIRRGGQCFVLYNSVENIHSFGAYIQKLLPDARIKVAHGRMDGETLEKCMSDFVSGEVDVLVSTTIIENGVDIPNANTMIICDADRLGLSQLYQLRGRVGRSERVAYAYFTYPEGKIISEDASKRLQALMDYTDLGSGFKIAMRDLEIRGAGNVLGKEQSGHMVKVGYDMYCRLLEEAVAELKGEGVKERTNCDVRIDMDTSIPEDYVFSDTDRMKYYKEIASVSTSEDADEMRERIKGLLGPLPESVDNLITVSLIKNLASSLGIKQVVNNRKLTAITFANPEDMKRKEMLFAIANMNGECVIQGGLTPMVTIGSGKSSVADKNLLILQLLLGATSIF